jgi:hypothetical protein
VAAIKPGEPWDYPSAASIPPVSIMNAEPPPPKGADGAAKQAAEAPAQKKDEVTAQAGTAADAPKPQTAPLPPTPPKRPEPQAAGQPAR